MDAKRTLHLAVGIVVGVAGFSLTSISPATAAPASPVCDVLPQLCPKLTATTPVTITGEPRVGRDLTATPPTWSDPAARTTYQWMRSGSAIPGATNRVYTVQADDVAQRITVEATGSTTLPPASGTSRSEPVTIAGGTLQPDVPPSITGNPKVGALLTAKPGQWDGDPRFTYQWYRGTGRSAAAINGATGDTYRPVDADRGRKLVVLVTATSDGYEPGTAPSNVVAVPKAHTTVNLVLSDRHITPRQVIRARITVRAQGSIPDGRVVIRDGGSKVATFTLRGSDRGVLTVHLPRFTKGVHRLKAIYSGDRARARSTSTVEKLVVGKRH